MDRRGSEGVGKLNCSGNRLGWGGGWNIRASMKSEGDSAEANDADGQENGILNLKRLFFVPIYLCQNYPHLPL